MFSFLDRSHTDPEQAFASPRNDLLSLISSAPRDVLDIGCGAGGLACSLKKKFPGKGCRVYGVELEAARANEARAHVDHVVVGSIEDPGILSDLEGLSFDVIILADVLEHLLDPLTSLKKLKPHLKEDGIFLISLPNIAHWTALFTLLVRRDWPQDDFGIFDKTHLHWFTRKRCIRFFREANLQIDQTILKHPLFASNHPLEFVGKILCSIPVVREYFAYQLFFTASLPSKEMTTAH